MAGGSTKRLKHAKKWKLKLFAFVKDVETDPKKRRIAWAVLLAAVALLLVHPSNLRADTQGANS